MKKILLLPWLLIDLGSLSAAEAIRHPAQQLRFSLLGYAAGHQFPPQYELALELLTRLFTNYS